MARRVANPSHEGDKPKAPCYALTAPGACRCPTAMGNELGVEVGQVIADKYRVVRLLGRGGMGSVWQCEHLSLMSRVAVKIIKPEVAKNKNSVARFLREAKAAALLRSPHVVQILDHGIDGEIAFIVMEMLEGESLHERLKRGPLTPAEAATVLTHVGRAMQRAHDAEIVHRDLKPDNVFLVHNDDEVMGKVLDFGIAKSAIGALNITGESPQTQTGALLGTPYYMSPEQATGQKDVDHRADLWAIGVIAYECLLGKRPYQSDSLGDLVLQICSRPQPVPSERGSVPAGFDDWFRKANHRDPAQRYGSARKMTQDLRALLTGRPSKPSMTTLPRHQPSETTNPQGTRLGGADQAPSSTTRDPSSAALRMPATPFDAGDSSGTGPRPAIAATLDSEVGGGAHVSEPDLETLDALAATQTPTHRRRMVGWMIAGGTLLIGALVAVILAGSPGSETSAAEGSATTGVAAGPTETSEPNEQPSADPSSEPSAEPSSEPSAELGSEPSAAPTTAPKTAAPRPVPRPRPVAPPIPRPPPAQPQPKDPLAI